MSDVSTAPESWHARQFILSPASLSSLPHLWRHSSLGTAHLYTHPRLAVATATGPILDVAVVGFVVDGRYETISHLAHAVADHESFAQLLDTVRDLSGRFCVFVSTGSEMYAVNDACSLRPLFYTTDGSGHAASDPALLRHAQLVGDATRRTEYLNSSYVERTKEHYLPAGTSLTPDVARLTPNHYANLSHGKATRFWPVAPRCEMSVGRAIEVASERVSADVSRAAHSFDCYLPLTAGIDSRLILAAANGTVIDEVTTYTLIYRKLNSRSPDVRIARQLSEKSGRRHLIIPCRTHPSSEFSAAYSRNTEIPHIDDWATIAFGIQHGLPAGHVALKGNCVEIARCFFYKNGRHQDISFQDLLALKPGWSEVAFLVESLAAWYDEAREVCAVTGYDLLDLFYWEHQMGSWQAQSQTEWDVAQECFTPFSCRPVLQALLATDNSERCAPNYPLFRRMIEHLDPRLARLPVNPTSRTAQVRKLVKHAIHQTRL